ncbi:MAG TPA: hypothetical protein DC064_14065 [Cyanobacteria bacterium UBA9273]|nr:hypothetical protein [Cyanobacteria bacterium UBA9273]
MDLPFILDIIIGLVFIYLMLSLLASELQEIIATLLQWRAKHLRESIENLLVGGEPKSAEIKRAKNLVDNLYNDPLLKNINQEAKGYLAKGFRKFTWLLSQIYRQMTNQKEGVFGNKRSGPSYISSETFATTIFETLHIAVLVEKLVELRLEKFVARIIEGIREISIKSNYELAQDQSFQWLQDDLSEILKEFTSKRATLLTSIDQLSESLDRYIKAYPQEDESLANFRFQLECFKQRLFGEKNERAIVSGGLKPSLTEIIDTINIQSNIHKEIKETMLAQDSEAYNKIAEVLNDLPLSVKESLAILARRAQTRVEKTENEVNQLREEISVWFDRSMARASGVYKRNAKGVAILLGFCIAFAANADTFHILKRLSNDENLRQVITERASQVSQDVGSSSSITQEELAALKDTTDRVLQDISLPISWSPANLSQQFYCSPSLTNTTSTTADSQDWVALFNQCIPSQQTSTTIFIPQKIAQLMISHPWLALKMIIGWFLSGLAIAMGAPFWFDLLGKVVNVRNSGKRPSSTAN